MKQSAVAMKPLVAQLRELLHEMIAKAFDSIAGACE